MWVSCRAAARLRICKLQEPCTRCRHHLTSVSPQRVFAAACVMAQAEEEGTVRWPTSQSTIQLYAEHLQNIRTLGIQASLATVSNQETRATLSADGSQLTLSHEGETATIRLPVSVGKHSEATLTIPAAPTKILSFRLNVEEKPGSDPVFSNEQPEEGFVVPWMSFDLTAESEIGCAHCKAVLLQRGAVKQWKDLPSEGWAEMMEFWHCHKPDVPHDHGSENAGRGFAANSKLAVQPGVGLVGPLEFLLAAEDCTGAKVKPPAHSVSCRSCSMIVGKIDTNTPGYRLYKRALAISTSPSRQARHFPSNDPRWLSAQLLVAAETQSTRRLAVYAASDEDPPEVTVLTHIWLFATDLTISSSSSVALSESDAEAGRKTEPGEVLKVVKVLTKEGEPEELEAIGRVGAVEGELELSMTQKSWLSDMLCRNQRLMPEKARRVGEWEVGLLRRFTREDLEDRR